jgi:hypothetical protein
MIAFAEILWSEQLAWLLAVKGIAEVTKTATPMRTPWNFCIL